MINIFILQVRVTIDILKSMMINNKNWIRFRIGTFQKSFVLITSLFQSNIMGKGVFHERENSLKKKNQKTSAIDFFNQIKYEYVDF